MNTCYYFYAKPPDWPVIEMVLGEERFFCVSLHGNRVKWYKYFTKKLCFDLDPKGNEVLVWYWNVLHSRVHGLLYNVARIISDFLFVEIPQTQLSPTSTTELILS